ncbi:MAG: group III truncated hemoglobin [Acidobacteria bacterium]|nr:group III truncated hemoglobin [Acidobacteriota bacterium]MCA1637770.1 group III truncated hemoglobin [Acidobacteriota bacterium]
MKDIENRADIDELMNRFYGKALTDEIIGYIFDAAELDIEKHLPIIGDFWETILFGTGNYQKYGRNPLQIHGELHLKTPLLSKHFRHWLKLFTETVDETYAGERAEFAKLRADAVANRMLNFVSGIPSLEFQKQE